jgi:hypothetical protein
MHCGLTYNLFVNSFLYFTNYLQILCEQLIIFYQLPTNSLCTFAYILSVTYNFFLWTVAYILPTSYKFFMYICLYFANYQQILCEQLPIFYQLPTNSLCTFAYILPVTYNFFCEQLLILVFYQLPTNSLCTFAYILPITNKFFVNNFLYVTNYLQILYEQLLIFLQLPTWNVLKLLTFFLHVTLSVPVIMEILRSVTKLDDCKFISSCKLKYLKRSKQKFNFSPGVLSAQYFCMLLVLAVQ